MANDPVPSAQPPPQPVLAGLLSLLVASGSVYPAAIAAAVKVTLLRTSKLWKLVLSQVTDTLRARTVGIVLWPTIVSVSAMELQPAGRLIALVVTTTSTPPALSLTTVVDAATRNAVPGV
jgi:hypothetical protein